MNMIPSVRATEPGRDHLVNLYRLALYRVVMYRRKISGGPGLSPLEKGSREGETPVLV